LNTTVAMLKVVPAHEAHGPGPSRVKRFKPFARKLRTVLGGPEERLRVGIVITHPWTGIRRLDPQPLQHGQHRRGLERGAVVAMQDGLAVQGGDTFAQRSAFDQVGGMDRVVRVMNLPAHDLAAVQIQNQVQVKPPAQNCSWQIGHIPAPNLARSQGNVGGSWTQRSGLFCSTPVRALALAAQYAAEGGLAGQVNPLIGQHGNDTRWRHGTEARLVGHLQQLRAFSLTQGIQGYRSHGLGPAIATDGSASGAPSLQRASVNAGSLTSQFQTCSVSMCNVNILGQGTTILEADHSSSPLWKIAETFFVSTNRAAVSASARSLRSKSRSSSLMRRLSWRVFCGLALASSGCAKAAVAQLRQRLNSSGYRPCCLHQAFLLASSRAAEANTASNRAAAVHARPRAGMDWALSNQRCNVPSPIPTSRATTLTAELSGGNNLATALSLNTCPYRAIQVFHHRPLFTWFSKEATTILTRGASKVAVTTKSPDTVAYLADLHHVICDEEILDEQYRYR